MWSSSGGSRLARLALVVALLVSACGLNPPGAASCQGVEAGMCRRLAAEAAADPRRQASSVEVRCATGACDQHDGEVAIVVAWSDGSSEVRMFGWNAEDVPPGFPVVPTCEAMNVDVCAQQAARSWTIGEEANIAAIHIRCDGVCNQDEGAGTSRVTFRDGRVREQGFAYAQAPAPAP
jgi:hypothetical protein